MTYFSVDLFGGIIKKILMYLGLYAELVQLRAPPLKAKEDRDAVDYEPYDDGWPGYEEPSVDAKSL